MVITILKSDPFSRDFLLFIRLFSFNVEFPKSESTKLRS
nr:MAG TPA: hypothetical protein [Caudoviricetes sp.]